MWQSLWVPESSTLWLNINISQAFYKWRFCANIHTISERKFETKNESKALLWHWEVNEIIFILNLRTLFEFRKVVGLFKFSNCLAVLPVDIVQQRQKTREKRASSDVEWMKLRNSGWEEHPYPLDLKLLSPFVFTWHKTTPISLLTLAIASRTASWVNWLMKRAEDASGIWAICFVGEVKR